MEKVGTLLNTKEHTVGFGRSRKRIHLCSGFFFLNFKIYKLKLFEILFQDIEGHHGRDGR